MTTTPHTVVVVVERKDERSMGPRLGSTTTTTSAPDLGDDKKEERDELELQLLERTVVEHDTAMQAVLKQISTHPATETRRRKQEEPRIQKMRELEAQWIARDAELRATEAKKNALAAHLLRQLLADDTRYPWPKPSLSDFERLVSERIIGLNCYEAKCYPHDSRNSHDLGCLEIVQWRFGFHDNHSSVCQSPSPSPSSGLRRSVVVTMPRGPMYIGGPDEPGSVWDERGQCGPTSIRDYGPKSRMWKWSDISKLPEFDNERAGGKAPEMWAVVALLIINADRAKLEPLRQSFVKPLSEYH